MKSLNKIKNRVYTRFRIILGKYFLISMSPREQKVLLSRWDHWHS